MYIYIYIYVCMHAYMYALTARHRADILEKATLSLLAANMDVPEVRELLPNLTLGCSSDGFECFMVLMC